MDDTNNSTLTIVERSRLENLEFVIDENKAAIIKVAHALREIRDGRLYRGTHENFVEYVRDRFQFEKSHAYRLCEYAEVAQAVSPSGGITPNERQARELAALEPEEQSEAWKEAVETAPDGKVTAAHVAEVVARRSTDDTAIATEEPLPHCHVANNSGEQEWYTPAQFIEAAREVLGEIDLDPASCDVAQKTVQAKEFFTKENDGLAQGWSGRVWMNPPYGTHVIGKFIEKICEEFEGEQVSSAIVLVNNATESKWFQRIAKAASAICFPKSRIKFHDSRGNPVGAPLQGQAILYLGHDAQEFSSVFSCFGFVTEVCDPIVMEDGRQQDGGAA